MTDFCVYVFAVLVGLLRALWFLVCVGCIPAALLVIVLCVTYLVVDPDKPAPRRPRCHLHVVRPEPVIRHLRLVHDDEPVGVA